MIETRLTDLPLIRSHVHVSVKVFINFLSSSFRYLIEIGIEDAKSGLEEDALLRPRAYQKFVLLDQFW